MPVDRGVNVMQPGRFRERMCPKDGVGFSGRALTAQRQPHRQMIFPPAPTIGHVIGQGMDQHPAESVFLWNRCWFGPGRGAIIGHRAAPIGNPDVERPLAVAAHDVDGAGDAGGTIGMFDNIVQCLGQNDFNSVPVLRAQRQGGKAAQQPGQCGPDLLCFTPHPCAEGEARGGPVHAAHAPAGRGCASAKIVDRSFASRVDSKDAVHPGQFENPRHRGGKAGKNEFPVRG